MRRDIGAFCGFAARRMIQTGSMIYELFEWTLTIVMTSEEADYYNGQQGDMWDAQKDMALAMLGSTIMLVYYLGKYKLLIKRFVKY